MSFTRKDKQEFNKKLKKAIKAHGNWSYDKTFRQKIRSIFQEVGKEVPQNSCSKHWFYDYLKKNQDVKETWENAVGQNLHEEEEDLMSQTTEITTDENSIDQIQQLIEEEELEEVSVLPLTAITYEKIQVKMEEEEDEKQSLSTAPSECEHIQNNSSWLTELYQDLNFRRGFTPAEVSQTFPEEH